VVVLPTGQTKSHKNPLNGQKEKDLIS